MCIHQNKETHDLATKPTSEDLPTGFTAAVFKPGENRIRHLFGMKCQSTVHNQTDEVVYAIVSNRIMGTTNTAEMNGKLGTGTTPAVIATGGGLGFGKKVAKGPTPVAIVPIARRKCHTFNLDSRSYYLTLCTETEKESGRSFHLVNEKVIGTTDYVITPNDLKHHVSFEIAEDIMKMIGVATKKSGDS